MKQISDTHSLTHSHSQLFSYFYVCKVIKLYATHNNGYLFTTPTLHNIYLYYWRYENIMIYLWAANVFLSAMLL